MLKNESKKPTTSRCRPFYPTACFELFHASTASYIVATVQLILTVAVVFIYFYLERNDFLLNIEYSRSVVSALCLLYAGGTLTALVGVASEQRALVHAHTTVITSLMVLTDMIAVGIVLIMAVGNRNAFIESIPHFFVDAKKFYGILGPFWMYLGAFSLHITVALNMCFMQVFTSYSNFLKHKLLSQAPELEKNSHINNNNSNHVHSRSQSSLGSHLYHTE